MAIGLASIVLIGLSANFPNPGVFAQINFAQGPSGPAPAPRNILVMGNKTTAGSATNDTVVYGPDTAVTCQTEQDVINLFGSGSQSHRAFLRISAVQGTTGAGPAIYYIAVAPSAGAAATGTIIFTTAAASNANLRVWVVDRFVDTFVAAGSTAIQIATAVVASINSQSRWPVTAGNSSGSSATVTITAKNLGPEGNWIVCSSAWTSGGSTVSTTITGTIGLANIALSGGTTADNNSNALATIDTTRYYYILVCDSDATNVGRVVTQVNSQAMPTTGIRQRVFYGSADTLANAITIATGVNAPRSELELAAGSDLTPLEVAANNMAIYSLLENSAGRAYGPTINNYSLFPNQPQYQPLWQIQPSRSGPSAALTTVQITSALNNGVTPLAMLGNGQLQLVKRITNYSLLGSNNDYRVRDAHRVSIPDWYTDDLVSITQQQFGGKDLLPNPKQGQPFPPSQATTPAQWGAAIVSLTGKYGAAGQLKNVAAINAGTVVQQEVSPPDRESAIVPLQMVDLADQFALLVDQVA
jgi:phage tail sheath gpL-like